MPDNDLIRLNIAIKPTAEMAARVIDYSRALAGRYEAEFVLDGINFFPHITLYSPVFPEKILERVIETVGAWSKGLGKVECIFHKAADENGFVILECVPTPEVIGLHNSAVNLLNPLREGRHKEKYDTPEYQAGLSDEQKFNIAEYGYTNVMKLYNPHLTVTRLKDHEAARQVALNDNLSFEDFSADTIAVYRMGENGTCVEPVKEFEIK